MLPIMALLPVLNSAISVIGAFANKGNAGQARASSAVQDAISVVNAVVPLVRQFAAGTEVSPEQVRSALTDMAAALSAFDAEIAKQADDS